MKQIEPQRQALAEIQRLLASHLPGASREPCSSDVAKEAAETHTEQSLEQTQGSYSLRGLSDLMTHAAAHYPSFYFVLLKLIFLAK